jgi:hypothetical protein
LEPLLLSAVKALAQPPEEQAAALGEASVDDLALDLDAQPWHDESPAVGPALDELAALLGAMSGKEHADLWTREALVGPEWQRVREAARRVLLLDRR